MSPVYVPRKTGIDNSTQIDNINDNIFDFNNEIKPIVNILVYKTIEQSLFELNSQNILNNLINIQLLYNNNNINELKWIEKQENNTLKEFSLKNLLIEENLRYFNDKKKLRLNLAGIQYMRQLTQIVFADIQTELYAENIWKMNINEEIINNNLPKIINNTQILLNNYNIAENMIDGSFKLVIRVCFLCVFYVFMCFLCVYCV